MGSMLSSLQRGNLFVCDVILAPKEAKLRVTVWFFFKHM